jgi:hypothetical protein
MRPLHHIPSQGGSAIRYLASIRCIELSPTAKGLPSKSPSWVFEPLLFFAQALGPELLLSASYRSSFV